MKQTTKKHRSYRVIPSLLALLILITLTACESESISKKANEPYNLTSMGNASDYVDLFQKVDNELMFGYFGLEILIAVFLISFMSFMASSRNGMKALAGASYIGFITSMFLMAMGILSVVWFFAMITLAALSTILIRDDY